MQCVQQIPASQKPLPDPYHPPRPQQGCRIAAGPRRCRAEQPAGAAAEGLGARTSSSDASELSRQQLEHAFTQTYSYVLAPEEAQPAVSEGALPALLPHWGRPAAAPACSSSQLPASFAPTSPAARRARWPVCGASWRPLAVSCAR